MAILGLGPTQPGSRGARVPEAAGSAPASNRRERTRSPPPGSATASNEQIHSPPLSPPVPSSHTETLPPPHRSPPPPARASRGCGDEEVHGSRGVGAAAAAARGGVHDGRTARREERGVSNQGSRKGSEKQNS